MAFASLITSGAVPDESLVVEDGKAISCFVPPPTGCGLFSTDSKEEEGKLRYNAAEHGYRMGSLI